MANEQTELQGGPVKAEFTGGVGSIFLFTVFMLPFILVIAVTPVINFFMPAIISGILRWVCDKTRIGKKRLKFTGTGGGLLGRFIIWSLLTLVTIGIYGFWATRNMIRWVVESIELVD